MLIFFDKMLWVFFDRFDIPTPQNSNYLRPYNRKKNSHFLHQWMIGCRCPIIWAIMWNFYRCAVCLMSIKITSWPDRSIDQKIWSPGHRHTECRHGNDLYFPLVSCNFALNSKPFKSHENYGSYIHCT